MEGDFEVEWSSRCPNINLEAGCWLAGLTVKTPYFCGMKKTLQLRGCATNSGDRWSKIILRTLCYAMHWFMMTWISNHGLNIGNIRTSRLENQHSGIQWISSGKTRKHLACSSISTIPPFWPFQSISRPVAFQSVDATWVYIHIR